MRAALDLGYRHIDTAQVYGNEAEVGAAIRDSGIPRQEIFVTTKRRLDSWRALERLLDEGRCRAIGVSNFLVRHLDELLGVARVRPHVNQVELRCALLRSARHFAACARPDFGGDQAATTRK